ncbi:MAG: GNAT family N-acetyltransferase [Planctomycetia bacterium]|jgi:dTDP-4-amino-4,6-dideoxy-D-galactose acyltransferase
MASTFVSEELCTALPWDSAFWGYPLARLNAPTLTEERVQQALAWCRRHSIRCLTFAACGTCPQTLAVAAAAGFRFVDVRVELERPVQPCPAGDAAVRPARPGDRDALCRLARTAHRDTRFFKDGSFARSRAEDLYATWICRDLDAHVVLVWAAPGEPHGIGGYVSCAAGADAATGRISLLAVDPWLRGRGIGRSLVTAAVAHVARLGADTVAVATQATNVAALRLYERAGFRAAGALVWFHKWFE